MSPLARRIGRVSTSHSLVLGLVLVAAAACSAPREPQRRADPAEASPAVPRPPEPVRWTDRFLGAERVLVADEVSIEGPRGLLDHAVTGSIESSHDVEHKTLPQGYRVTIQQRVGAPPAEIRAQLDQLTIVATRRLVLLERPGPVDVVLTAQGDVFFKDGPLAPDVRQPALRLEGRVTR